MPYSSLDIVVHPNIRLSGVIVSDILDTDHLLTVFHTLDYVKTTNLPEPNEKFTDSEHFETLASYSVPPRIEINSEKEADKVALNFTASTASAYRLSTNTVTLSDIYNQGLPGLGPLLKHKQIL
jgi:hypothetical protein